MRRYAASAFIAEPAAPKKAILRGHDRSREETCDGDRVLLVRNAGMLDDWIWTVCAVRGTTVENLGADATMTKPTVRGTSRMGADIRTVLRAVEG